jgi:hypothetical protein
LHVGNRELQKETKEREYNEPRMFIFLAFPPWSQLKDFVSLNSLPAETVSAENIYSRSTRAPGEVASQTK